MTTKEQTPRPDPMVVRDSIALSQETLRGQIVLADGRLRRMDSLLRLGVFELGGILAVIGLLANLQIRLGFASLFGFGTGVLLNIAGLLHFLAGTSGFPRPYSALVGPRLGIDRLDDPDWDHLTFSVSVLDDFDRALVHNEKEGRRLDTKASTGSAWLIASVICYVATLGYILGGLIYE